MLGIRPSQNLPRVFPTPFERSLGLFRAACARMIQISLTRRPKQLTTPVSGPKDYSQALRKRSAVQNPHTHSIIDRRSPSVHSACLYFKAYKEHWDLYAAIYKSLFSCAGCFCFILLVIYDIRHNLSMRDRWEPDPSATTTDDVKKAA